MHTDYTTVCVVAKHILYNITLIKYKCTHQYIKHEYLIAHQIVLLHLIKVYC